LIFIKLRLGAPCERVKEKNDVNSATPAPLGRGRLVSLDLLRGLVMILMALDHGRYYFSGAHVSPEDMAATNLPLFMTRWITHLCAPAFFFLTGLSIYLSRSRQRAAVSHPSMAVARGVWLIVLELTVVGFAWTFNPGYSIAGVIWCLGWAMIFVGALSLARPAIALGAGAAMMVLHNLLDPLTASDFGSLGWIWSLLHAPWSAQLPWNGELVVLFPLIPWIGVAALGYGAGPLFEKGTAVRRRALLISGWLMLGVFAVLRLTNAYGNPARPSIEGAMGDFQLPLGADLEYALIGFLNVEKYPPSLQYLLLTLGVCALLLGAFQRYDDSRPLGAIGSTVRVFGLVPMFFYVLHLFVLHTLALVVARVAGQPDEWLGWGGEFPVESPATYGYSLPGVYLATAAALALLYFPCLWFARFKARTQSWWATFL
jgi:uncharacterized membrane protein